ncbi:MAG TPA: cation:proton antiporter [Allosphingosinicella sp.]|nr:cation:proton antiporter [Allosphingosinicella sp.]
MAGPTEFSTSGISDALVILGAAGIVIPAFARIRINPVIGFILIGVLIGPFGLGQFSRDMPWLHYITISNIHAIEPFAEFGIILLLFSIGLELSFRRLWGMRALVFGVGATQLLASAFLIGVAVHFAGYGWTASFALGIALAMSSTAVVLPLVGTTSPVGRSAFAMLLFEDLALVPIVFALGALDPRTDQGVANLLQTLGVGALVVAAMLILGRYLLPPLFAQAARTKSPELFLSASLLVVIAASLATTAAGLSPIVGALVAGILIAETDYHGEVEVMMAPFRGLGLGIFLITVGMSLNLRFFADNWALLLLALVGVMLVKTIVTAICLRWAGKRRRAVAAEASLLMASPSETSLIVLGAAGTAGLIASDTAAFWQVVTAMGLTLTPLLARIGRDAGARIEKRGGGGEPAITPTREEPRAVIIGFGRVGRMVAEMLKQHDKPYVAVDSNIDAVKEANRQGFNIVFGDAARPEFLDKLNLGHASALILTMDDPVQAVRTVKRVRAWCPDLTIVARARDSRHAAELYRAGVTDAVPETLESSLQLSEAVLVDLGMAMGPVIASIHEKRAEMRQEIMKMGELEVEPTQRGKRLRDALDR